MNRQKLRSRKGLGELTDSLRWLLRFDPVTEMAEPCAACHLAKGLPVNECSVAEETHEIARGTAREFCTFKPTLCLPLCRPCHEEMGSYTTWPVERQLALAIRLLLSQANHIRGRSPLAITHADVAPFLEAMP